jgi:desulfoferrodoxin-like iron-binding protein
MAEKHEVFKCTKCGQIIAILQGGEGTLICCEEEMINVTPDEGKKLIHDLQRPGAP